MKTERDAETGLFKCTDRDRAAFESGIKLGSLFHQFIGAPVNLDTAASLEEAMERCMSVQPCVIGSKVSLDRERIKSSMDGYGYCAVDERMIKASVEVEYRGFRVEARLEWVEELQYPLMWIASVEKR